MVKSLNTNLSPFKTIILTTIIMINKIKINNIKNKAKSPYKIKNNNNLKKILKKIPKRKRLNLLNLLNLKFIKEN